MAIELELNQKQLQELLARQLTSLFAFYDEDVELLDNTISVALSRCEVCFSGIKNKYYQRDGVPYFNPFHSGQYSIYLYYLSNAISKQSGGLGLADRIYYLNKALNGLDLFYAVEMPDVFFLEHPVGTVIGRGSFGNGFSFLQNCTVGNNHGVYPRFGENVRMQAGAKVIGNCNIGSNVIIGANAFVKDTDIPDFSIVVGQYPNNQVLQKPPEYFAPA